MLIETKLLGLEISIKVLISIFLANIISMLVLNTLVLSNAYFILIYLSALIFSAIIIKKAGITFLLVRSSKSYWTDRDIDRLYLFCIILSFLLIIPRCPYFLEGLSQSVIHPVCADDYWHIQELNSLINSQRYPAQSSFLAEKYFSFYYAPWLIAVFLYKILPFNFITIKLVLALTDSLYIILIITSTMAILLKISDNRKQLYLLTYLIFLHAGIESLAIFWAPLEHHEWWMATVAGFGVQISSFVTLAFWVIHHLSAAIALVLSGLIYYALQERTGREVYWGIIIITLLVVYAFYSSIFVVIGAMPFVIYLFIREYSQNKKSLTLIITLSFILTLPILWIYLSKVGNNSPSGFHLLPITSNFHSSLLGQLIGKFYDLRQAGGVVLGMIGFFPFLLCLMGELLAPIAILILSLVNGIKLIANDAYLLILSILFLMSTYFISFTGANNYAMRGAIIPIAILCYVASKYGSYVNYHDKIRIILLVILALGSINEVGMNFNQLINQMKPAPMEKPILKSIYSINIDRNISHLSRSEIITKVPIDDERFFYYYLVEKLLDRKNKLLREDLEIISDGPFGPWRYQDWQKK